MSDCTFCPECESVLDFSYAPSELVVHGGSISALGRTYDGKALCTGEVKRVMEREKLAIDFVKVNSRFDLYHFHPRLQLMFDTQKRNTRFINPCPKCGGFAEVIGSQPVFLRNVSSPILEGLFRTDLEFGSGRGKSPELIVGLETKKKLERLKHGGCTYLPIVQDL